MAAFVELHIEQGAILDEADIDIGVVEGIVGIRWWDVTVEGVANHAGTTPMDRRRDALVTAAELALAVNRDRLDDARHAGRNRRPHPGRTRRTERDSGPRHPESRDSRPRGGEDGIRVSRQSSPRVIASRPRAARRCEFAEVELALEPAPTDERLRKLIEAAAKSLGLSHRRMPSGAGHDSQEMAHIAPIAMIFVPSKGGVSHAPQEFTTPTDIANGANVLLRTLLAIDRD